MFKPDVMQPNANPTKLAFKTNSVLQIFQYRFHENSLQIHNKLLRIDLPFPFVFVQTFVENIYMT